MTIKYILNSISEHDGIKEVFNNAKEANELAYYYWNQLTRNEKKRENVYVEKVDETCLIKEAIDEQGNIIDWTLNDDSLYTNEELFDSDEYEIYSELLHNIQFNIDHEREAFYEYKNDFRYHKSKLHKSHQEELQKALDLEEDELED